MDTTPDLDELAARARTLLGDRLRILIGIAGSPGSGKTTLSQGLVARLNEARPGMAAAVPMDGFHLANARLAVLGRGDRKGAIDTFDGWGFVALLQRLRGELDHDVHLPSFRREVDEPIAGELVVGAGTSVVVVEGNYLLADLEPWDRVRGLLDQTWFCAADESVRIARLVERHMLGGRSLAAATDWAHAVDGANATLIEATAERADLIVHTNG